MHPLHPTPYLTLLATGLVRPEIDAGWSDELSAAQKRRDPRIWQMAQVAASRLLKSTEERPRSIISATTLGALDETRQFLEKVFTTGFGSPRNFIASVHNSMAGKLALELKVAGPNLTFCDGPNSLASALVAASLLSAECFPCLVMAIDEKIELLRRLIPHLSGECRLFLNDPWEEAAVAILITDAVRDARPRVRALGPVSYSRKSPNECFERLAHDLNVDPQHCVSPFSGPNSCVYPGILLHEFEARRNAGMLAVGTFSPSAKSAAMIQICA
jgi:hypothetical protein